MCEVNYFGRMSHVSNYFYCHIQPAGEFYDAERDLLAIAKFLVSRSCSRHCSSLRDRGTTSATIHCCVHDLRICPSHNEVTTGQEQRWRSGLVVGRVGLAI